MPHILADCSWFMILPDGLEMSFLKSQALKIRKATSADADALASCIEAAYAKHRQHISDLPPVSDGIADDIAAMQVWVATQDGEVIAGLFLVPQDDFMKLANLAVHPHHHGKGLGRQLAALSEREARRQGYSEMRLNTHLAMPENVELYEHLGWEIVSTRGNTVSMRRCLAGS